MTKPERSPPSFRRRSGGFAGGSLLAVSIVAGVIAGILYRQASIGFLAGLGVGLLLFILVFLADLRR